MTFDARNHARGNLRPGEIARPRLAAVQAAEDAAIARAGPHLTGRVGRDFDGRDGRSVEFRRNRLPLAAIRNRAPQARE